MCHNMALKVRDQAKWGRRTAASISSYYEILEPDLSAVRLEHLHLRFHETVSPVSATLAQRPSVP